MRVPLKAVKNEGDGMRSTVSQARFVAGVWAFHVLFHTIWVLLFVAGITGLVFLIPLNALYFSFVLGFMGSPPPEITMALGYVGFSITGISSGIFAIRFLKTDMLTTGFISVSVSVFFLIALSFARMLLS